MTAIEQIKALRKVRCKDAVQEIRRNGNRPLSPDRLNHHIDNAISTGLVSRVVALVEIRGRPLTIPQIERLTKRCLQLEWVVDALSAARLGAISNQTRRELIAALISKHIADNRKEALHLMRKAE